MGVPILSIGLIEKPWGVVTVSQAVAAARGGFLQFMLPWYLDGAFTCGFSRRAPGTKAAGLFYFTHLTYLIVYCLL